MEAAGEATAEVALVTIGATVEADEAAVGTATVDADAVAVDVAATVTCEMPTFGGAATQSTFPGT